MDQRAESTRSARELAERSAREARAATLEFEQKTAAARGEIYRQMDEMRRTATAERAEILTQTRAQAEADIAAASRSCRPKRKTPAAGSRRMPRRWAPRPPSAFSAAPPDSFDPPSAVPE